MPAIEVKRIYDAPARGDGLRILVDRIWPRGISKEKAALDFWAKDVAPSTALRQWFHHAGGAAGGDDLHRQWRYRLVPQPRIRL